MKKLSFLLIVVLGTSFLYASDKVHQTTVIRDNRIHIISNNREYEALPVVTVKYLDLSVLQTSYNVIRYNKLNYADLETPSDCSLESFVSRLETDGNILGVDYNSVGEYNSIIPNDEYWNLMWHIPAIRANDAWSITMGTPSVKIGVLDSGTDWTHPDLGIGSDLYQNICYNTLENDWSNPNDPTTGNNIDDDSNGFIDDYKGWNFDLNTNDSRGSYYHGTFVAGIISAKTNNASGVSGIAGGDHFKGVNILPYCVGMTSPNSSVIDDAIIAAVDNGANIIQFSLSCQETNAIKSALLYAKNNDVIVVCSSGNDEQSYLPFPAKDTTVIAVGAINQNYHRADFSNYGSNLRLVAPGVNIYGLNLTSAESLYCYSNGTSFAAPQASGVIALMLSVHPYLNRNEITQIIESTAQKVGGYSYTSQSGHPNGTWNEQMGYGLVDAYAAVVEAKDRYDRFIQGPDYVCDTTKYYLIHPSQPGDTVTWSVSNGVWQYPHYSIVGPANQDTVYVRCERMTPVGPPNPHDYLNGGGRSLYDQKLMVTISNGTTKTYEKLFREPQGETPVISASNSSTQWRSGSRRTFTISNCSSTPDNALRWEVRKIVMPFFGNNDTTFTYYTGRTLSYRAPSVTGIAQLRITAINTQKECDPNYASLDFLVSSAFSLNAYTDNGTLQVEINEQDEETRSGESSLNKANTYSLELWHNIYGCMRSQTVQSMQVQMDINGLPQGVYVLLLKENGNVIADTKVPL